MVLFVAFANLLFHSYFNNRYGYFRDEFDYMACGDHLAWGYVTILHWCRSSLKFAGSCWGTRFAAFDSCQLSQARPPSF